MSLRALGFFVIHVGGRSYGSKDRDATMLAVAFNRVGRRLAGRGTHIALAIGNADARMRISAFQEVALIAGEHHEKLDGSGYPDRKVAPDLCLESRVIAVADIYGALSEDRPYRAGLKLDQIIFIMKHNVPDKLDAVCFEALLAAVS